MMKQALRNKQIAFAKVILPSGEILRREVIKFNAEGLPESHFPLKEEIAFAEWYNTTYEWPDDQAETQQSILK